VNICDLQIWILVVTRNILLKSFPTAENGWLRSFNWQLHCCNTVCRGVQAWEVAVEISCGKLSYLRISERCRKRKVKIGRVSSSSTLQSGRTGQILESGKDLYCITQPSKKIQKEADLSTHGTVFGWRSELSALRNKSPVWTLDRLVNCDVPIEVDTGSSSLRSQYVASPPNQEVEFRGNHHISLFTNFNQEPWILAMYNVVWERSSLEMKSFIKCRTTSGSWWEELVGPQGN